MTRLSILLRGLYRRSLAAYGVSVVTVSAATAIIVALNHAISIPNSSLLYLPPILFIAVYFGTGPSLVAATVAVVEYDFFLLQPLFTFSIGQAQDVLAFVIFLFVAVLTSQLAARARARADAAQQRATESSLLYELSQALTSTREVQDVLQVITERIVAVFGVARCAIYTPTGNPGAPGALTLSAETGKRGQRERETHAAAAWVFRQGTEVGLAGESTDLDGQRAYFPLRTADRIVGVMEIGSKPSGEALDTEERSMVTSFAAQAALLIARVQAEEERHRLLMLEERDRMKSTLLSAVSHDLRTPLASIKAAATGLLLEDALWTSESGREVLRTIDHEVDRLNRLVGNLLDLSRIEAGVLRPVLDWYDINEVVDQLLARLQPLIGTRRVTVEIEPEIPPVRLDLVRIEELVLNLFENALKYTPADRSIELCVRRSLDGLSLAVVDHGPGIPESLRQRVFETFYRGRHHSDHDPGTGLGLAICRGIAQAHGGTIEIEETAGGGATLMLRLPAGATWEGHIDQAVRV